MLRTFRQLTKPTVVARRRFIQRGVFGGNRTWLFWGGLAWVGRWVRSLLGHGSPTPRYAASVKPGERVVLVHEPLSPLQVKKAAKVDAKASRKQAKKDEKRAKDARIGR